MYRSSCIPVYVGLPTRLGAPYTSLSCLHAATAQITWQHIWATIWIANQRQSKIGLLEHYFQGPRSGVHRLGEYRESHIDSDRGEVKEEEAGEMEEE